MGSQNLILVGLISDTDYREANLKIPFSFFSVFIVILLLLFIHLPILRIYILGVNERIRERDIRLIIGSYFVAAFFGFFIFTKIFLNQAQVVQNRRNIDTISGKIVRNFQLELNAISRQLSAFDSTLNVLSNKKEINLLKSLSSPPGDKTIGHLDSLFQPLIYPYPNNVFWISDSGRWVARWGFKETLTKSPLIGVADRTYFQDFAKGEPLFIDGVKDSIAIQPTLSKLEGEYVVTVAKRSFVHSYQVNIPKAFNASPSLIGLSAEMHSVYNVVMPPGYNFSIIDESGVILYDSKPGRPLLSNIYKEMDGWERIQQTAIYRNTRYFENLRLRSKDVALLSSPISGMPYQLLVYYNRARSDEFEEHLITLSSGLIGAVILLVIFSSLINRWSKEKYRMLESSSHHFEWLYTSNNFYKQRYYRSLIRGMLLLFGIYLLAWISVEALPSQSEFSFLFTTLLFPFYIAVFYYELRERYYDVQEKRTAIKWYYARPSLVLRGSLLVIIVLINCCTAFVQFSWALAWPVLITQLVWVLMIMLFSYRFRHLMLLMKDVNDPDKKKRPAYKISGNFIWAILIGVTLVSIVPAFSLFWLFYRQETALYLHTDQMIMAKEIEQRARVINQHVKEFKYQSADTALQSKIKKLKFSYGIYTISGRVIADGMKTIPDSLLYPANEYIQFHDQTFPGDSLVLDWTKSNDAAEDSTWSFVKQPADSLSGPELLYSKRKDRINPGPFRLTSNPDANCNTSNLILHSFSGMGTAFSIFFIVGLCFSLIIAYFLTLSLAKRIFLVELQQVTEKDTDQIDEASQLYEQKGIEPAILSMISKNGAKPNIPPTNDFKTLKDIYHFEKKLPLYKLEAMLPSLISTLEPVYYNLWNKLSARHKFILFDFAQDGFANYKAGKDLQALIEKGLLFFEDQRLCVMTLSFQEYILQRSADPELNTFLSQAKKENTWNRIQTPLLVLLMAAGIFIFATQEEVYKKITGLLTTITSLLPLLNGMFGKASSKGGEG